MGKSRCSRGFNPKNTERRATRDTRRAMRHPSISALVTKCAKLGPRSIKKEQSLARANAHIVREAAEKAAAAAVPKVKKSSAMKVD